MDRNNAIARALLASLLVVLVGCGAAPDATTPAAAATPGTSTPPATSPAPAITGASVFTMNNDPAGNAVLAFLRQSDGSLLLTGTYPTGGKGSGSGLGNQAALAFSTDHQFLFVVNAGSADFTIFQISPAGLTFTSRTPSGGARPISVTEHQGLVYVLDLDSVSGGGGFDLVTGFRVDATGQATALPNSSRPLSARTTSAAQVALSPDGSVLLVTERSTAIIDAFPIDSAGLPAAQAIANQSVGTIPFGFQFLDASHVLVSEEGPNATSSYTVSSSGELTPVSRSVPALQPAVCWLAISPDHRFAFTGNTSGASVSGYSIRADSSVSLLRANGLSASTDGGALDVTVSGDNQYLYATLNNGTLETFRIGVSGSLTRVQSLPSLGAINGVISL